MKTDELINLLAEDASVNVSLRRIVVYALVVGIAASSIFMISTIGMRRDMMEVIFSARVLFKIGATIALAAVASNLLFRVGRPASSLRAPIMLFAVPLVLVAIAVIAELSVVPSESWKSRMVGANDRFCLMFIPVLALVPLVAFFAALRHGAPENPGFAGATAGLAAGAIGGAIYAWHCPDDSPLFVATWYTLAIAIVTAVGYLAGRRFLRW